MNDTLKLLIDLFATLGVLTLMVGSAAMALAAIVSDHYIWAAQRNAETARWLSRVGLLASLDIPHPGPERVQWRIDRWQDKRAGKLPWKVARRVSAS